MKVNFVRSFQEINDIRRLFREYEAYLNVDLCFQQFESELANLPGKYGPPSGALLLANDGGKAVGCGALRSLCSPAEGTCEMKRLYVVPEARRSGIGRKIAERLIKESVRLGYSTMVLDTLDWLEAALHLYESLGFTLTEPYYDNPLSGVIYLKMDLNGQQGISIDKTGDDDFDREK